MIVPEKKVAVNARVFYIFALPALLVFLLLIAVGVLFGLIGLPWWLPALFAIPAAVLTVWLMSRRADQAVLQSLGARGLGQTEGQRVLNTVENLCLSSGIAQPNVQVIDTPACNIAAVSGNEGTLVVTTGLLETLDLMQMEGAVAHALTKLSTGAAKYGTLAASAKPFISKSQIETAQHWGTGDAGVVSYDISGVGLTRYPPGLRSALEQIDGRSTDIPGATSLGDAWFIPPSSGAAQLGHRIEVLWELQ